MTDTIGNLASLLFLGWGAPDNLECVKRYRDQRIARFVVSPPSTPSAEILPTLDRWAEIIRKTAN